MPAGTLLQSLKDHYHIWASLPLWGPTFSGSLNISVGFKTHLLQEYENAQLKAESSVKAANNNLTTYASEQTETSAAPHKESIHVNAVAKVARDLKLRMAARAAEVCARAAVAVSMSVKDKLAIFQAAAEAAGHGVQRAVNVRFLKFNSSKAAGLTKLRFSDEARGMEWSGAGVPQLILSEIKSWVSNFKCKAAEVQRKSASLDTLSSGLEQTYTEAAKASRRAVKDTAEHAKLLLVMANVMCNPDVNALNKAAELSEDAALAEDAAAAAMATAKSAMKAAEASQKFALKSADTQQTITFAETVLFITKAAGSAAEQASNMAQSLSALARLEIGRFNDLAELHKIIGGHLREFAAGVTSIALAEAKRADLLSLLSNSQGLGRAA